MDAVSALFFLKYSKQAIVEGYFSTWFVSPQFPCLEKRVAQSQWHNNIYN